MIKVRVHVGYCPICGGMRAIRMGDSKKGGFECAIYCPNGCDAGAADFYRADRAQDFEFVIETRAKEPETKGEDGHEHQHHDESGL